MAIKRTVIGSLRLRFTRTLKKKRNLEIVVFLRSSQGRLMFVGIFEPSVLSGSGLSPVPGFAVCFFFLLISGVFLL